MEEIILAKYGELALKGQNRPEFEAQLIKTIKRRIALAGEFKVYKAQSTIYIEPMNEAADINKALELTSRVFGISALHKAMITAKNLNTISQDAVKYLKQQLMNAKTFKVSCKRSDKSFTLNSMELARE
ncbi:MAG: THUMP domain-containing protein, partial [Oscillospiraceae bacterium]|nr:THUMP domain-containing protein [Oscillospiraceae bacterium]